jgi:predicted nucleotidyltransferase component of viral defense system
MSKAMQLKAKVRNFAIKNNISAQAVLQNFMLERLLERISISKYKDGFILKGGMLIASLVGINSRTTMDMDTTLQGYALTEELVHKAMSEICSIDLEDDVIFTLENINPIRDKDKYGGYRVALIAKYESINNPLKIDITTGDIITPKAVRYTFQSSYEDKEFNVWAYNIETILAEKVETILRRSVFNTRPRDFYDIYILMKTKRGAINKDVFITALRATSEKRESLPTLNNKERIIKEISGDEVMRQRWNRYCNDNFYANNIDFPEVISELIKLLSFN